MRSRRVKRFAVVACFVFAAVLGCAAQQTETEFLTNQAIMKLVRAGFKEKTVVAIIRSRPNRFDLSPDRLIELKRSGVSEKIILAMIGSDMTAYLSDEGWADDPFFRGVPAPPRSNSPKRQQGGTGVFGSSGSQQSENKSQGGSGGSSSGDAETTGTATVKIIRPPSEPGAEPKLERTPSLTNEGVIELVEAGFSEGTIIRRVEQSPADFDFSPQKLAELKRRRVTEPIIAAMRAAMGEGGANPIKPQPPGQRLL